MHNSGCYAQGNIKAPAQVQGRWALRLSATGTCIASGPSGCALTYTIERLAVLLVTPHPQWQQITISTLLAFAEQWRQLLTAGCDTSEAHT
jgi:hypothetical protein